MRPHHITNIRARRASLILAAGLAVSALAACGSDNDATAHTHDTVAGEATDTTPDTTPEHVMESAS